MRVSQELVGLVGLPSFDFCVAATPIYGKFPTVPLLTALLSSPFIKPDWSGFPGLSLGSLMVCYCFN